MLLLQIENKIHYYKIVFCKILLNNKALWIISRTVMKIIKIVFKTKRLFAPRTSNNSNIITTIDFTMRCT